MFIVSATSWGASATENWPPNTLVLSWYIALWSSPLDIICDNSLSLTSNISLVIPFLAILCSIKSGSAKACIVASKDNSLDIPLASESFLVPLKPLLVLIPVFLETWKRSISKKPIKSSLLTFSFI